MRPRVLHLVGSFHQGGSERQALQLARLMRGGGLGRVELACLDRGGPLRAEAEAAGFAEVAEYRLTSFYDLNFVAQLRRFARHLRRHEIEVVQTHDFYTNVFGMAGAALARVPARVAARRETDGCRSPSQKRVERAAYRLAHAVVANADAVAARLRAEGVPGKKIVTVYNGLDAARVAPPAGLTRAAARRAFGLPADEARPVVTIVANLRSAVKDHPTFLRAAARAAAEFPEAVFAVAGEGELTGAMRELAGRLGVGRQTFFTGRCEDVAALLYASDVCVLSSRAEGFSNSILEYMAAGRPVAATDVGGAREAVVHGETGFLAPAGDDEALAAHLAWLLGRPAEARAMGEAGRRRVLEKFSCEAQLAATLGLYERLLKGARAAAGRAAEKAYGGGA